MLEKSLGLSSPGNQVNHIDAFGNCSVIILKLASALRTPPRSNVFLISIFGEWSIAEHTESPGNTSVIAFKVYNEYLANVFEMHSPRSVARALPRISCAGTDLLHVLDFAARICDSNLSFPFCCSFRIDSISSFVSGPIPCLASYSDLFINLFSKTLFVTLLLFIDFPKVCL